MDEVFVFLILFNIKGVKFIIRELFVLSEFVFNYFLSLRYEEMDLIVVFDYVLVLWDCVFFYDNVEVVKDFMMKSLFYVFIFYQVVIR